MDRSDPIWPPDEVIGARAAVSAGPDESSPSVAVAPDASDSSASSWASTSPWASPAGKPNRSAGTTAPPIPDQRQSDRPSADAAATGSGGDEDATGADLLAWVEVAADNGWTRDGVPDEHSPWALPPRTMRFAPAPIAPGLFRVPDPAPGPSASEIVQPDATDRPVPPRGPSPELIAGTRIAVISGDARVGGLVAKLLATALDNEHRSGALVLDAGADVGSPAWRTAVDRADQVILAVDAVGAGPATAARTLDRTGMRQAMTVVLLPPARRGLSRGHEDIGAIRAHFEERTKTVLFVPNDIKPTIASLAAWRRIIEQLS